jgi:predicted secreted hydrolase
MGVNLHDGGALMAFRMRDHAGGERWASATHRGGGDATSGRQAAPDQKSFGPEEVQWTPLRTWRSPRTGVTYPVAWRVEVGNRRYRVEPLLLDAELDSRPTTGILYWEGPIRLIDEATGKEAGRGYLELTGYGGKLDL